MAGFIDAFANLCNTIPIVGAVTQRYNGGRLGKFIYKIIVSLIASAIVSSPVFLWSMKTAIWQNQQVIKDIADEIGTMHKDISKVERGLREERRLLRETREEMIRYRGRQQGKQQ